MGNPKMVLNLQLGLDIAQILRSNINPSERKHWDKKIREGIIPTEATGQKIDPDAHQHEVQRRTTFEVRKVTEVLAFCQDLQHKLVHYIGIGTADALPGVLNAVNKRGADLIAYDISRVGYENGQKVINSIDSFCTNLCYQADIEFVCDPKFIDPDCSALLIVPRVLDVLDNVSGDKHKMERTAKRLGRLLEFLQGVLLIHPCPEGNEHAVFRDTTLYSLEQVLDYMEQGLGSKLRLSRLGTVEFYRHIYTAAFIRK